MATCPLLSLNPIPVKLAQALAIELSARASRPSIWFVNPIIQAYQRRENCLTLVLHMLFLGDENDFSVNGAPRERDLRRFC